MSLAPRRILLAAGAATALTFAMTACSSGSSSSEGTSSPQPTSAEPTVSPTTSDLCTDTAILGALPQDASLVRFDCADVGGTEWAAAEVNPGPTVFFLQANNGTWDVSTSDEVCGTASAGLPPKLLDYCTAASPTAS